MAAQQHGTEMSVQFSITQDIPVWFFYYVSSDILCA